MGMLRQVAEKFFRLVENNRGRATQARKGLNKATDAGKGVLKKLERFKKKSSK